MKYFSLYEQKLKKINEAYETLSNPEKKKIYDDNLKSTKNEELQEIYEENQNLRNEINNLKNNLTHTQTTYTNTTENINPNNQYYENNYTNIGNDNQYYYTENQGNYTLQNMKYKLKRFFKNVFTSLIAIIVIILLFYLLWHVPFINKYLSDLYYNNPIVQYIKNLFIK